MVKYQPLTCKHSSVQKFQFAFFRRAFILTVLRRKPHSEKESNNHRGSYGRNIRQ